MKKYIEPKMQIGAGVIGDDIAQGIGQGSVDEQLGKERWDDTEDLKKENDSWTDGLW